MNVFEMKTPTFHYRLEWDLVDAAQWATPHQVREWDNVDRFLEEHKILKEAEKEKMIVNLTATYRTITYSDWKPIEGVREEKVAEGQDRVD